ncbi:Mannan endo-1-6-alpha-mannosidase DCW1 [Penicillium samsonianum]|uniref:Mannan endo-1-6-alpha-mannosidase DCW1 n=1 Tax=Penicillium samsonianum TaxID=1882272 RepID=UPI002546962E|nr:Mannan endo-1-6-alpha-mannosidase DCW1 [Penicillium samsonianum]KAJ6118096.1 Mannan endo-1-6-alpha-mannosidase DCW1 [Penicillium samsonianum]
MLPTTPPTFAKQVKTEAIRRSYNAGVWLRGASVMYNWTSSISNASSNISSVWQARTDGLLSATDHFFSKANVMYEPNCDPRNDCNIDQLSFKGYLSRWLAEMTQYAPYTYQKKDNQASSDGSKLW